MAVKAKETNLLTSINAHIKTLTASEKVTKASLPVVVDELLHYVPGSKDIDALNRLLAVLTPANQKLVVIFMKHHIEWDFDDVKSQFTTMVKGDKTKANRREARVKFLKSKTGFWEWVKVNAKIEKRAKNFTNEIINLTARALKDGDNQITGLEVVKAIFEGGVSLEEVMQAADDVEAALALEKAETEAKAA